MLFRSIERQRRADDLSAGECGANDRIGGGEGYDLALLPATLRAPQEAGLQRPFVEEAIAERDASRLACGVDIRDLGEATLQDLPEREPVCVLQPEAVVGEPGRNFVGRDASKRGSLLSRRGGGATASSRKGVLDLRPLPPLRYRCRAGSETHPRRLPCASGKAGRDKGQLR